MVREYLVPSYDALLDLVDARPGDRVLDVGCGTGELELRLCRRYEGLLDLVGVEPAPKMLAIARTKLAREGCAVEWHDGYLQDLEADLLGKFDWLLSSNILHWLADPVAEIGVWATCLKSGGRMVNLTLDGGLWPIRLTAPFWFLLMPGFTGAHTLRQVISMHERAGLVVELAERRRFGWFLGAIVVRAHLAETQSL